MLLLYGYMLNSVKHNQKLLAHSGWPFRWARRILGPQLPAALQAELTRDLGNYFWSFAFAGPVAAVAAPSLGQHTAQVLQEAGFTDQQIEKLRELAVI